MVHISGEHATFHLSERVLHRSTIEHSEILNGSSNSHPKRKTVLSKLQATLRSFIINNVEVIRNVWMNYLEVYDLDSIFLPLEVKQCCFEDIKETITDNSFLTMNEGVRIFMVEGDPGMGKTTWVNKIAKDWATDIAAPDVQPQFSHVFLIPLNQQLPNPSLSCILDGIAKQTKHSVDDISNVLLDSHSLIILDGYDENPCAALMESIKEEKEWLCKIIVTTRSSNVDELLDHRDAWLRITGFSIEIARQFFNRQNRCFPEIDKIVEICQIPLYAAIFCGLKNKRLRQILSSNSIQVNLIEAFLDEIYRASNKKRHLKISRKEFKAALSQAGKIALCVKYGGTDVEGVLNISSSVSETPECFCKALVLQSKRRNHEKARRHCLQLGLISVTLHWINEDSHQCRVFSFPYKTIEDYVSAKELCRMMQKDRGLMERFCHFNYEYDKLTFFGQFFNHCLTVLQQPYYVFCLQNGFANSTRELKYYTGALERFTRRTYIFEDMCFTSSSNYEFLSIVLKKSSNIAFNRCTFAMESEQLETLIAGEYLGIISVTSCHISPQLTAVLFHAAQKGIKIVCKPDYAIVIATKEAESDDDILHCWEKESIKFAQPIIEQSQTRINSRLTFSYDLLTAADSLMFQLFTTIGFDSCELNFELLSPLSTTATERIEVDGDIPPLPSSIAALMLGIPTLKDIVLRRKQYRSGFCSDVPQFCSWEMLWRLLISYHGHCKIVEVFDESSEECRCSHGEPSIQRRHLVEHKHKSEVFCNLVAESQVSEYQQKRYDFSLYKPFPGCRVQLASPVTFPDCATPYESPRNDP